ncbi:BlaI/MecI/CopY family transcriptional regulator [Candidatus Latescibacterota bacterium]
MTRRKSATFTEVELEFMHVIWELGEVSTEDVQKALDKKDRHLSDGSIRKILSILIAKGHLIRRRAGRSFFYRTIVPKAQSHSNMVQDFLKRAFCGSVSHMVATLLDSNDVKEGDIKEIKRLIKEFERKDKK